MQDRTTYKRLVPIVRQILLTEWDPIGVGSEHNALDEYDSTALTVVGLLMAQAPPERLAVEPARTTQEEFGLPAIPDREAAVAVHLVLAYRHAANNASTTNAP